MALHEVQGYCYAIHAGNRTYIYEGSKSGLKEAVERVKDMPRNAGTRVRYHEVK